MYNIIKCVCAAAVIFCVSGCAHSDKTGYETEAVKHESENYTINSENIVFDLPDGNIINNCTEEDIESWKTDFEARVQNNEIKGNELPNMQVRQKVKLNSSTIISMVTEKYVYISGAHGNTWWKARNYDIVNNRLLRLEDLFYDNEFRKILSVQLEKMIEENPEEYHDLWEQPKITAEKENDFYMEDNKLVLFYQPYELSYYAKGVIEFPIEAQELRGYLKEEYLSLLCS